MTGLDARLEELVRSSDWLMAALRAGRDVDPPDWLVGGGVLRDLVWDRLHGGPTNLTNLALLCRAHHRAVHEGGWHLHRHPNGDLTATPPHRRQPVAG